MSKLEGLYEIRDFRTSDTSFVMATFLRGLYYGDSWFSLIPKNIFMTSYKPVGETFLKSPKAKIKIACLKDDQDVILGYSILSTDDNTVIWVFVKKTWRLQGLAKALVPANPVSVMHLTDLGRRLMIKLPNTIFNPFAF